MVQNEKEIFVTSTPLPQKDVLDSSFACLFSPIPATKTTFDTPQRNGTHITSLTKMRIQLKPLPFIKKESVLFLKSLSSNLTKSTLRNSLKVKRTFLNEFPSRLSSRRFPSFKGISVRDVHSLLNACGESYKVQFSLAECYKLYHRVRALQTLQSPLCKMTNHHLDSSSIKDTHFGASLDSSSLRQFNVSLDSNSVKNKTELTSRDSSKVKDESKLVISLDSCSSDKSYSKSPYVLTSKSEVRNPASLDSWQDSGLESSFEPSASSSLFYEPIFSSELDVLKELGRRNCYEFTKLLLSYLLPNDLQTVCSVSKTWRGIVLDNKDASRRRDEFLTEKMLNKENKSKAKRKEATEDRTLFEDIANKLSTLPEQPLERVKHSVFQSFIEVGKNLNRQDILLKCPKCNHPSKKDWDNKFCCTRQFCAYTFCCECLGPFLTDHACNKLGSKKSLPSVVIGSKKSMSRLRRL